MEGARLREQQIAFALWEAERDTAVEQICRNHGISR